MTAVTAINFDDSDDEEVSQVVLTDSNLYQTILDLEIDVQTRVKALELYQKQQDAIPEDQREGNGPMELLSQLSGMYHFSGTKNIEHFLLRACTHGDVPSLFKVEAAKSLLTFDEDEEDEDDSDYDEDEREAVKSRNELIRERNSKRKTASYKALDCACYDLASLPTPCKIEAVCMLMECPTYKNQSASYFTEIITDQGINCDYRYKTILGLERRTDDTGKVTFERWKIPEREFFLEKACFAFIRDQSNETVYRILAGQYLLQKLHIGGTTLDKVQEILLGFAEDEDEEYNLRADAADTLLSLGESDIKAKAREIIMVLGRAMGEVKTVFDNAQNVHVTEIEKSVAEALEFLSGMPLLVAAGKEIDFAYVNGQINDLLEAEKDTYDSEYVDKVQVALNRINVDRVLYSKFNQSLVNILLKVWTYLSNHEAKDVMKTRMLEELWDMSGTCSSGFASRLVNVISAFGDFNMRIGWGDQITANLTGRLNARARHIADKDSMYHLGDKHREIVELYMRAHGMLDKRTDAKDLESKVSKKDLINTYLEVDGAKKIDEAVEEFAENVLNEMTIPSSQYDRRQNFNKFCRDNILSIREELYEEFSPHVTDTDFDLWFRSALSAYETGSTD